MRSLEAMIHSVLAETGPDKWEHYSFMATIFAAIWALAIIGITQEIMIGKKTRKYSLYIYVFMGWLILFAIKPFINSLPEQGVWWIVTCGMCYMFGLFFFLLDEKFKHFHGKLNLRYKYFPAQIFEVSSF